MTLRPSSNGGGLDQRRQTFAYMEARAKGDVAGAMIALGCPEVQARRAGAYAEVRSANPNLAPEVEDRVVAQKLSIMGVETRTTLPSSADLHRRVAEVGRLVLADQQTLRSAADDNEDDDSDLTTCPNCGHIWDDTEEQ